MTPDPLLALNCISLALVNAPNPIPLLAIESVAIPPVTVIPPCNFKAVLVESPLLTTVSKVSISLNFCIIAPNAH